MAFTNYEAKEINCKVVYFGAKDSGKTANLRSLYQKTTSDIDHSVMEFKSEGTHRFFSFLPVSLGYVKDFHLKMHLFVLPEGKVYETVPDVILKGVDGFVFVADSRIERLGDNISQWLQTKKLLSERGYKPLEMPSVFQYNKRDLNDIVELSLLQKTLNLGNGIDQEAVATEGIGTMETLQAMAKQIVQRLSP